MHVGTISVIIPVLNEALRIEALVQKLVAQADVLEVIVADGGSRDDSPQRAAAVGATVLSTERGRGRQLVSGVAQAKGDVLWFVHADTLVPDSAASAILSVLTKHPSSPGGNFRLLFDGEDEFSRWLIGFYAWIRRHGFYYGDSGIFVRRSAFEEIGGLQPLDLMEDYDLVRRMERAGPTLCVEDPPLVTSSRRFKNRKAFAIVSQWLYLHALYHMRAPGRLMASLYDSAREARPH